MTPPSTPTPERATDPTPEALEAARVVFNSTGYTEASPYWMLRAERLVAQALDDFAKAAVTGERKITRERIETFAFGAEGAGHIERAQTARDVIRMLEMVSTVFDGEQP